MSFLDKLLEGVEIKWKSLGDYSSYDQPTKYRVKFKDYSDRFKTPVLTAGKTFILGYTDETEGIYNASDNPVIIFDDFTTANKWVDFDFKVKSSAMKMITSKDESKASLKYIFYWLNTLSSGLDGDHKRQWISNYANKKLPIPCPNNPEKSLKIQKEIVRILDTFTELTTELTTELSAELKANKKQYNYYREQLLSFDESEVEHLPMGNESIGKFIRGGGLQKKDFTDSGVGCIHYGQIYTHYGIFTNNTKSFVSKEFAKKARIAKYGDLVIATTSENDEDLCKAVAWLGKEEIAVSSDACFYRHNLNPKFVAYFFQTEQFHKQKRPFITGAKVRRVNASKLEKIKIPVPSKEEQERIVNILDKFDILTTSISEGLSKEIELRKKQYEYYREKLLSFPIDAVKV